MLLRRWHLTEIVNDVIILTKLIYTTSIPEIPSATFSGATCFFAHHEKGQTGQNKQTVCPNG